MVRLARLLLTVCLALVVTGCKVTPSPRSAVSPPVAAPPAPKTPAPQAVAPAGVALPVPSGLPTSPGAAGGGTGPTITTSVPESLLSAGAPEPDESGRRAAVQARLDAVRAWVQRSQLGGVLISVPATYAWLTLGASNDLGPGRPSACLAVLPDRVLVLAPSDGIDTARVPLRGLGWSGRTWRYDLGADEGAPVRAVQPLSGSVTLGADTHRPGTLFMADELTKLRRGLFTADLPRYRWLAAAAGQAVAEALAKAAATESERAVEQRLRAALAAAGVGVAWVCVTALERLASDGLAPAGETKLASGAAVQVVATRWGLQTTVGRTVTPQARPEASEAFVAARRVYAAVLGALALDARLADVARAAAQAGAATGTSEALAAGPVAGVGACEPLAQPCTGESEGRLVAGDVMTVTVRLPRAYLADTVVVGAEGLTVATASKDWPSPAFVINGRAVAVPTLRGAEEAVVKAEQQGVTAEARLCAARFLERTLGSALAAAAKAAPAK